MPIYRERKGPQGRKIDPKTSRRNARGRLADTFGGGAELAEEAPTFLPARAAWSATTKRSYLDFARSPAARVLRSDDLWGVRMLFEFIDRLDAAWAQVGDDPAGARTALAVVRTLQDLVSKRSKEYGFGPSARKALGIPDAAPAPSALDAYRRDAPDAYRRPEPVDDTIGSHLAALAAR